MPPQQEPGMLSEFIRFFGTKVHVGGFKFKLIVMLVSHPFRREVQGAVLVTNLTKVSFQVFKW